MTRTRVPKKTMSKPEAISYLMMGTVAYVALWMAVIVLGGVFLMFMWGYIAPVFGLPLLNLSAATSIAALALVWKKVG